MKTLAVNSTPRLLNVNNEALETIGIGIGHRSLGRHKRLETMGIGTGQL